MTRKRMVYWEKTPGRWGRGEYLYADGDKALVDVHVDGGKVLEWIEVSRLKERETAKVPTRSEIPSTP